MTCRGVCGASYHLNKKKLKGPDGSTCHTFYAWEDGIPAEIANKSGRTVMSVAFLTQVALAMSRMRYIIRVLRVGTCRCSSEYEMRSSISSFTVQRRPLEDQAGSTHAI